MRKLMLLLSLTLVAFLGYFGASYAMAQDAEPELPGWLPAASLPAVTLPDQTAIAIHNLLSEDAQARFGVSAESYDKARVLAETARGPLYVIPGTTGVCLALADAIACSELKQVAPVVVVLLVPSSDGESMVGGGLVTSEDRTVVIVHEDGTRTTADAVMGGFTVTESDAVRPHEDLTLDS